MASRYNIIYTPDILHWAINLHIKQLKRKFNCNHLQLAFFSSSLTIPRSEYRPTIPGVSWKFSPWGQLFSQAGKGYFSELFFHNKNFPLGGHQASKIIHHLLWGSATEWSVCQTRNLAVSGSSPALSTTWICFSVTRSSNPRPCL